MLTPPSKTKNFVSRKFVHHEILVIKILHATPIVIRHCDYQ